MEKTPLRILLLGNFNGNELIPILKKCDYHVATADQLDLAVHSIVNEEADLVISSNRLNGFQGFEVYNHLKGNLINAGIPFFMVLNDFEKEEVLIGLEMGIDNFLFSPFIEPVIVHAIENCRKKKTEINLFETDAFKHYFYNSSVAMFFKSDGKISMVNDSFCRLIGTCCNQLIGVPVAELFDFNGCETNKLDYKRFISGVVSECTLKNVRWLKNDILSFDISFYRGKTRGINNIFAEMVTSYSPKITYTINTTPETTESKSMVFTGDKALKCDVVLTSREKQIFALSAQGMALKQIASELGLSQRTVEKHRANIMHKTKTTNFIETMIKLGHKYNIN